MRPGAWLLAGIALALAACPEERGDTRRRVPAARVPPAVPVEPPPADGSRDGGAQPAPPPTSKR